MSVTYDPTQPFPAPLTPGEFGRAWLDSLWANERATYHEMQANGQLQEAAAAMETAGQEEMTALLKQTDGRPTPAGLTPLEYLTQRKLAAREEVMANLVVPPDE